MPWQDDPIVEEQGQPSGSWLNDPVVDSRPRRGATDAFRNPRALFGEQTRETATRGAPAQDVRTPRRAPTWLGLAADFVTGANRRDEGVGEFILETPDETPNVRYEGGPLSGALNALPQGVRSWLDAEGRNVQTALGFALDRNEQSRAQIVARQHPRSEFRRDQYGNLQVRVNPQRPWTYLNRPGLSVTDATNFAADAVALLPAARGARAVGMTGKPALTLGGRALAAAAGGGATEAARQTAAIPLGGRGPQAGDIATTAIAMGVAQPVDDLISAGVQAYDDLGRAINATAPDRTLTPDDIAGAQEIVRTARGRAQAEVNQAVQTLRQARNQEAARAVTPDRAAAREAYAGADEFGVDLSRGQATGNVRLRQSEDAMLQGSNTEEAQQVMAGFADRQTRALQQSGIRLATRGQEPLSQSVDEAGVVFADAMRGRRDALRTRQSAQYREAFRLAEADQIPPSDELLARVDDLIEREFLDVGPARTVIERLQSLIQRGQATFATVERARQELNRQLSSAMASRSNADEFAINQIINELDGWAGAVARNPAARDAMSNARGMYSELRRLYGAQSRPDLRTGHTGRGDPGGAAVERVLDTDMTGQQIAEAILGGTRPTRATLGAVRRIVEVGTQSIQYTNRNAASGVRVPGRPKVGGRTVGERRFASQTELPTDEIQGLREAVFHRVLAPLGARQEGGIVPAQTVVTSLDRALNGPGREILETLFQPREIAAMRRYHAVLQRIVRPVGVNTSGTAAALSRSAQQAFDALVAVLFGGANIATLGVAGAVRQSNRQLEASMAAQAATRRPGIFIQLPRRFAQGEVPRAPLLTAEERVRADETVGAVSDRPEVATEQRAPTQEGAAVNRIMDGRSITSPAPGLITFPDRDGRQVTLEIGNMSVPTALREWAAGRLQPVNPRRTRGLPPDPNAGAIGRPSREIEIDLEGNVIR